MTVKKVVELFDHQREKAGLAPHRHPGDVRAEEDIVEPGMGELVAVGDAGDLARGILAVLDGYRSYDLATIRRRVEERYDYRELAKRIAGVYEEVLEHYDPERNTDKSW